MLQLGDSAMSNEPDRPKTIREALDELEKQGLGEAVAHVRSRMNEDQSEFIRRLTGKDFSRLMKE